MNSNWFNIGVDAGYSDVKTPHLIFPTGYQSFNHPPYQMDECLEFNGNYYISDEERFAYEKVRTDDEKVFVLTLMAIAKEILETYKDNRSFATKELMQNKVNTISEVVLGVGLPPGYISQLTHPQSGITQKDCLVQYYEKYFGNGVTFTYNDIKFDLKLKKVMVYPQDYAAAVNFIREINKEGNGFAFEDYNCIDIGGYTVDRVPIINKKPQVDKSVSIPFGIIPMYGQIQEEVSSACGVTITPRIIECVFRNKPTILDENVKEHILKSAESWYNQMINTLIEKGTNFETTPAIFFGGGTALFEKLIRGDSKIKMCECITDPKANAKAYAALNMAYIDK